MDVESKEEKDLQAEHEKLAEEMASGRQDDTVQQSRWGGGEIQITKVQLLDQHDQEKHVFATGERMQIKMFVRVRIPVEDFVFGIGIFNTEGICCYGTNTYIEEFQPVEFKGAGEVTFSVDHLNLVEGTYFLDVAAHRKDDYPYDYHRHLYTFKVRSEIKDVGIFRPQHRWEFSPNIRVAKS
jgi:hypothetical protein